MACVAEELTRITIWAPDPLFSVQKAQETISFLQGERLFLVLYLASRCGLHYLPWLQPGICRR